MKFLKSIPILFIFLIIFPVTELVYANNEDPNTFKVLSSSNNKLSITNVQTFLTNGDTFIKKGEFDKAKESFDKARNLAKQLAGFYGDLNNSYKGGFRITNIGTNQRPIRDSVGGDKLFRNDDGYFNDVSEESGIYGSVIGFGLGVTVGDVNNDGWMDIYVSNDFFERDYLYINNADGTFSEELEYQIKSISAASMGADMADINNDGYSEIFVTDMLPEPDERIKTVTTFDNWDRHQYIKTSGYLNQFTRNALQLNNGDGELLCLISKMMVIKIFLLLMESIRI